jgi:hypothetical protein
VLAGSELNFHFTCCGANPKNVHHIALLFKTVWKRFTMQPYAGSYEFKLRGNLWSVNVNLRPSNPGPDTADPTDKAMAAVRLMKCVLELVTNSLKNL